MEKLFNVKHVTISYHINNIYSTGELKDVSVEKFDKSSGGRQPKLYSLDMIISVGYRVNSKQGKAFRKWATSILKDYMIKGYTINQKRLDALQKTIETQSKVLSSTLEIDNDDLLRIINEYTKVLDLLH